MDGQARGNSSSNLADDEKCFDECIVCSDQVINHFDQHNWGLKT